MRARVQNEEYEQELRDAIIPGMPTMDGNAASQKAPSLTGLKPEDVATQLTLIELSLFKAIKPEEFVIQLWCDDEMWHAKLNLTAYVEWFNRLSHWVSYEICQSKKRSQLITLFIRVASVSGGAALPVRVACGAVLMPPAAAPPTAQLCRRYNNFSSLYAIVTGLNHGSVHRLRKAWVVRCTARVCRPARR